MFRIAENVTETDIRKKITIGDAKSDITICSYLAIDVMRSTRDVAEKVGLSHNIVVKI